MLAALLWYDYALTWTREVRYFWTKRFTLSTLLYILCRYGMVANILYTLAIADKLPTMRVRFDVLRVVNELNLLLRQVFDSADRLPLNAGLISVTLHLQLRRRVSNLRNPECSGSNRHFQ